MAYQPAVPAPQKPQNHTMKKILFHVRPNRRIPHADGIPQIIMKQLLDCCNISSRKCCAKTVDSRRVSQGRLFKPVPSSVVVLGMFRRFYTLPQSNLLSPLNLVFPVVMAKIQCPLRAFFIEIFLKIKKTFGY